MSTYHEPVLLSSSVAQLRVHPEGTYVDMTLGGGGHSRAIAALLGPGGRLVCLDRDREALAHAPAGAHVIPIHGNYRDTARWLDYYDLGPVDGILADLGVSSWHLDSQARGFSFQQDGPLDMRMDAGIRLRAEDVVMKYPEEALADLFWRYGELASSRHIARGIVARRRLAPIRSTGQLREIVLESAGGRGDRHKLLACAFQALRIEVNGELESLESMLGSLPRLLKPGGRAVIISYHSLEDRLVKNFLRAGRSDGRIEQNLMGDSASSLRLVTRGAEVPTPEEMARNPRARSARMRVGERR